MVLRGAPGELSGDHARDPVAAHAHAVERVGGVHRALLVRDDDELGAVRVALHELEEAVDVDVVERGLDLVEDVERARPREEDGEHERERHQRLLAAGEQRQSLRRLAGWRDLDLDAAPRSPPSASARLLVAVRRLGSGPAATGRGPISSLDEPQRAAAAREADAGRRPRSSSPRRRRSARTPRGCGGRSP